MLESSRIEELARRLAAGIPEALGTARRDLESNFKAVLQSTLGRLDLTTREEFDVQSRLLERLASRLEQAETRVGELEARLRGLEGAVPPVSDQKPS
jgi:ubiquinone biosynthesis accessory factor UbiK